MLLLWGQKEKFTGKEVKKRSFDPEEDFKSTSKNDLLIEFNAIENEGNQ